VALTVWLDARGAAHDRRRLARALAVEAQVEPGRQGRTVPVRYHNPVTDQALDIRIDVWDIARLPEPGERVPLEVDPADPEHAVLAGDRRPATAYVWWYVPLLAVPTLVAVLRQAGLRRAEALVAREADSFAMLGAVTPPGRLGRRSELHLYAADAAPGAAPLCSVALAATAGTPIGGPAFPVEVKGSPRPLGRVVARAGGRVLWPAGRALLAATAPHPAAVLDRFDPVLDPALDAADADTDGAMGLPLVPWWRAVGFELAALAALTLAATTVTAVTVARWGAALDLQRHGTAVVAEVVDGGTTTVGVAFELDGRAHAARAPVDDPGRYDLGRRYPARVDPADPGRVRLEAEPYDPVEPVVWGWLPAVATGAAVARRRWAWRRARRVAAAGPWARLHGSVRRVGAAHALLDLRHPATGHLRCSVPVADAGLTSRPPPLALEAAGTLEPGGWVAVRTPDRRPLVVTGAATAPRVAARGWRGRVAEA
jgi:hypothetical protein